MSVASRAVSLLAPPRCGICGAGCSTQSCLCDGCESDLAESRRVIDPGPAGVDLVVSAGAHRGTVRSLATSFKFGQRLPLARRAAAAIQAAVPAAEALEGVLVPVPPDPIRFRIRGFDPAEEIAIALARTCGLRLDRCLERARGRRQVGRPRRERVGSPPRVRAWRAAPRAAILVDDVWTTGATLSACARALREAGSESVVALTLAHAT